VRLRNGRLYEVDGLGAKAVFWTARGRKVETPKFKTVAEANEWLARHKFIAEAIES